MIVIKLFFVLLILIVISANQKVLAQLSAIHDFKRVADVIVINENNDTLLYPFAGGLNNCQVMNMDINLDGTDDILIFDRHGFRILPFIVSASSPGKYLFKPELAALFPPIEQWMQALDYNHDGKMDIFTYTTGGIKVYRNDSESTLKFTLITKPFIYSLQGTTLTNILVTSVDYPAIADVDADGDLDILTFWGLGSFVEWHRNTSMERFGNADSLTFVKSSSCWGQFAEGIEDNTIILDTCSTSGKSLLASSKVSDDDPKHTGSTLLVNDLNGDWLPDITLGDVDFSKLIHLTNGGTLAEAKMISQTSHFPNAVNPVSTNTFPAAMLADVNNDGRKDLLISPFDPSLTKGENLRSLSLYGNSGTNSQPDYRFKSNSFLQDQMLDFGSGAYPVFIDYNGDGLMDVLVGNYGYSDSCVLLPAEGLKCSFTSKIALLLNEGTLTNPQFRLTDRNIAQLDTLHLQSLIPDVADLDGDGDLDLVCGNSAGKLIYCENRALPGQPANFVLSDPPWAGIDVGDFSSPQLFDLDQDGLTDLICGKKKGTVSFFKNTGTKQEAQFSLVIDSLGGVDVTDYQLSNGGYSVPRFYTDKQGDIKLFVGSEFGEVYVYDQIKNNLEGDFRLIGAVPGVKNGWQSSVAIGNLNSDTITDMLVGNYSGGIGLFYGKAENTFGIGEQAEQKFSSLKISPNPADNLVSIDFKGSMEIKPENMLVLGIEGKIVRKFSQVNFPILIDVSGFQNGIYLLVIQSNKGMVTGKLVICR